MNSRRQMSVEFRHWRQPTRRASRSRTRQPLGKVARHDFLFLPTRRTRPSRGAQAPEISRNRRFPSVRRVTEVASNGQFAQTTTGRATSRRGTRTGRMGVAAWQPPRGLQPGHPRSRSTCEVGQKRGRLNAGTIGTVQRRRADSFTIDFSEVNEIHGGGILPAPKSPMRQPLGKVARLECFFQVEGAFTKRRAQPWPFSPLRARLCPMQNRVTRRGRPRGRFSEARGEPRMTKRSRGGPNRAGIPGFFRRRLGGG